MSRDLNVVVVGSGRLGLNAAEQLAERGHNLTVIERHPEQVEAALDAYVATVVEGDASRPSVLEQAGLDRADVLAALTDTPGTNLAVCLAAKRYNSDIRTVLRASTPDTDEYAGYVDVAEFPEQYGARVMTNAVEGAGMRSMEGAPGDLEFLEIEVADQAPVAGRSLADVSLPEGTLVVSAASGDRIAGSDTELVAGQRYVVAVEPGLADEVRQLFRG